MDSLTTVSGSLFAGIAFDPTIRGILAVAVGVVVLMGSVYLLLGTNTGNRLGFLLAMTGFFGWMSIMGAIWWIYGIGMLGEDPSWDVIEYNAGDPSQASTDPVRDLDFSVLPTTADGGIDYEAIETLAEEDPAAFGALAAEFEEASDGWQLLAPGDAVRNEAEAEVSAVLPECSACSFEISEPADYKALAAFVVGGKDGLEPDANWWDRVVNKVETTVQLTHPPRYAILQVQKVIEQEPEPGQPPPTPEVDEDEPVINVVMLRDIGDRRFPSAVITVISLLVFLTLCWVLHQRERLLEENLEQAEAHKSGAGV